MMRFQSRAVPHSLMYPREALEKILTAGSARRILLPTRHYITLYLNAVLVIVTTMKAVQSQPYEEWIGKQTGLLSSQNSAIYANN